MTYSRKDVLAYARNPLNVAALSPSREVETDLATHTFTDAAIDILTLSDDEFRRRIPEFGFAAAAIVGRIAKVSQ